jgi:hypothetical protein
MLKKIISTSSIISLTLLSSVINAETDPDFTNGVLTLPKVISGATVFQNVKLGLDFANNGLSLINFEPSTETANADTNPEFTNDILTMPRVVSNDALFTNVRLNLSFSPIPNDFSSTFTLLDGYKAHSKSRFNSKKNGIDEILNDTISKLTWVNGSHACMINADAAMTATTDAIAHCNSLDFAGYQDWRAPTSAEIAEMIVEADALQVKLNYRNPNCQFMATSDGFVQTENNSEPGKIVETAVNSGTRCVRDN